MGVTLERVQNKFACIIGELCSEPIVLSQFAVWVDLRISEYKTNGTISLDCSGESPNPSWMKGVKNPAVRNSSNSVDTGQGGHRRRSSYANSPNVQMSPSASPLSNQMYNERLQSSESPHHSNSNTQNFSCRLSPDILVIKDEEDSDQPSSCALSRKRPSEADSEFLSPGKSRRLGNETYASSAQESSSNQSLMSIINTENDSVSLEPVESDNDIFKVTMEMQEDLHKGQGLSQANSSTFSPRRPSATATSSSNSPVQSAWPTSYPSSDPQQASSSQAEFAAQNVRLLAQVKAEDDVGQEKSNIYSTGDKLTTTSTKVTLKPSVIRQQLNTSLESQPTIEDWKNDESSQNLSSRRSLSNTERKAKAAVRTFETWLSHSRFSDTRKLENIPIQELSYYVTEFFRTVKKPMGGDYLPNSYASLRSGIEWHLVQTNYGYSIKHSAEFAESRFVFLNRRLALAAMHQSMEK